VTIPAANIIGDVALAAFHEIDNHEFQFGPMAIADKVRVFQRHAEPLRLRICALELAAHPLQAVEPNGYVHLFDKIADEESRVHHDHHD
jgi:hypothetical protein